MARQNVVRVFPPAFAPSKAYSHLTGANAPGTSSAAMTGEILPRPGDTTYHSLVRSKLESIVVQF